MNKKISLGIAISLMAIAAAITFILTSTFSLKSFNAKIKDVKERAEKYTKFEEFDTIVRTNFNGTIDEDALLNAIFSGYTGGINDKYAKYYTPEEYAKQQQSDSGEIFGIGVTYSVDENGYLYVVTVYEDSPASDAGIAPGDLIVKINDSDVASIGKDEAIAIIEEGEEGSSLTVVVRRDDADKSYTLERRTIEEIVVTGELIENNIGYIRIKTFNQKTAEQFNIMLYSLINKGAEAFIFDVRDNGGGLISSVEAVLNDLLPEGDIVKATYNDGTTKVVVKADATEIKLPMTVLVNGFTASSAEIFAAALRDFGKAQLVGTKTYGKGVMQNTFMLSNGGAVTVTVASFSTTKAESFDGIGLSPEFESILPENLTVDMVSRDEDVQLLKAIEVVTTSK